MVEYEMLIKDTVGCIELLLKGTNESDAKCVGIVATVDRNSVV